MYEHELIGLASVLVLGIAAQWLAWRLKLPSILFLLIFGFVAGPVTGFLHPDELLGQLLLPVVSISVAIILFEGGLTLRLGELREIGKIVLTLISVGVVITWIIASAATHFVLGLPWKVAVLLGSILVVTGPTVIGPLLHQIRPLKKVGAILRWEGIVIDPVGAMLALLVFEAVLVGEFKAATSLIVWGIVKTVVFGGLVGFLTARFLVLLLKRFWLPDFLQEAMALMLVVISYITANFLQPESGLFAATIMGLALDNQRQVDIKQIVDFKENLRVLIISSLFILLAARLQFSDFLYFDLRSLAFLGILIFIARPLAVFASTFGSGLTGREKLFISWVAPRGIVAAAVSSVFALRLAESGLAEARTLVPITFMVIVGTVAIYGLTAAPIARWLGVAQANPQGALIMGAHSWARAIVQELQENGFRVMMVDTNRSNVYHARMENIQAHHGSALSEHVIDEMDLDGIGRFLALTSNDEANSLAALNCSKLFEREELYQLHPQTNRQNDENKLPPMHLRGRFLFGEQVDYQFLSSRFLTGWSLKSTRLSDEFDYEAFQKRYNESAIPLFLITENKKLIIITTDAQHEPKPGQTIVALVQNAE